MLWDYQDGGVALNMVSVVCMCLVRPGFLLFGSFSRLILILKRILLESLGVHVSSA